MPVEIQGLDSTLKAMRKFEPDLAKNLNKQIRVALIPIQKKAQGFVPDSLYGLSNWSFATSGRKINAETSAFATENKFPKFNAGIIRQGMKIIIGKSRYHTNGFSNWYSVVNISRAGAIMESAGRTNPTGRPWDPKAKGNRAGNYSKSDNPYAGEWFINHQRNALIGEGKRKGRLLYRAYKEDQGFAFNTIEKAVKMAIVQFKARADANDVWRIR